MNQIIPNWSVPRSVQAFSTTRKGGVSLPPFNSFNLGDHVGDDKSAVKINRTLLVEQNVLPHLPLFLTQIHSTKVIHLPHTEKDVNADAVYTNQPNQVCLVMTADCLPVLLTNKQGNEVAAAHAGWRGLCNGILEETVRQFRCTPNEIIAWLGPAIGPNAFQVGKDVVEQFVSIDPIAKQAFKIDSSQPDKYLGNLYQLATQRLNALGIFQISGGEYCTFTEKERFFSFRREKQTGRMASLIWFRENE
ncbi:peptidoglycan editing factor PgeF [Rodentibacter caecimuris]|uniref:Purine nucleoside phosphorylase n=1 Tax=Rodentibacter caecimuris TaxID=1796644 RepID=A0ABX3KZ35_9PAST|nr:multi-copper polyphenol oxidoreductase [Rodentibacter heylii]